MLCPACSGDLPRIGACCQQCGLPGQLGEAGLCAQCLRHPPSWDKAIAALSYEYPVDHLVRRFKFHGDLACGQLLAEVLAQLVLSRMRLSAEYRPDLVIPVPLHFLRRFRRGYNQAELLARVLHQRCGIPIALGRLRRVVNTEAQSGLDRKARRKNLEHAFACKPVEAGHVALVDDVLTTGTTLQECASVIKKAGAGKVSVWVAARAAAPVNQH